MNSPAGPSASPRFSLGARVLSSLTILLVLGCAETPKQEAKEPKAASGSEVRETPLIGTLLPGEPTTAIPVESDDIVSGEQKAPVTLVAFLDYQCGFCAQGFGRLAELRTKYKPSELRIVIKHLPLDFHPEALPAAIAAQAVRLAANDDAALSYSRTLFENQANLSATSLAVWAEELGVPRDQYNELVSSEDTVRRVASDVLLSRRLGITGTPAFFINGRLIAGAEPLATFSSLIDDETSAVAGLLKNATWEQAYTARLKDNSARSMVDALLAEDPGTYRVPVGDSPKSGPNDALVTIAIFTDFECPYCKRAEGTVAELERLYPGKLRFVWKQLPLPFHRRARPAALISSLIYREKGAAAFFQATRELFEVSPDLSDENLTAIAVRHGASKEGIEGALSDRDAGLAEVLARDSELADDVAARGTPHFFINGLRLSGARPLAHFRALIDEAEARAKTLLKTGVAPSDVYATLQKDALSPGAPVAIDTVIAEADHPTRGAKTAPVAIHIFSDFECPYCRNAERVIEELEKDHPGQLRFIWHDLPLPFHAEAEPAARVGRLVFAEKGEKAFWAYHDKVFALDESAPKLGNENLAAHAKSLGVDGKKVAEILARATTPKELVDDQQVAETLGIRGTPAFVVGKYVVTGAQPKRHFERLIALTLAETSSQASPKNAASTKK